MGNAECVYVLCHHIHMCTSLYHSAYWEHYAHTGKHASICSLLWSCACVSRNTCTHFHSVSSNDKQKLLVSQHGACIWLCLKACLHLPQRQVSSHTIAWPVWAVVLSCVGAVLFLLVSCICCILYKRHLVSTRGYWKAIKAISPAKTHLAQSLKTAS